jgi:hypothetical protein
MLVPDINPKYTPSVVSLATLCSSDRRSSRPVDASGASLTTIVAHRRAAKQSMKRAARARTTVHIRRARHILPRVGARFA